MYLQLERTNWVKNLLLTGCLFCGPLFLTFCFLNTVAIAYSATAALPSGTILVILLIWALVTSPLLVLGGVAGPPWMNLVFCFLNSIFSIDQVAPTLVPLLKFYFHEEVRKATVSAGKGICGGLQRKRRWQLCRATTVSKGATPSGGSVFLLQRRRAKWPRRRGVEEQCAAVATSSSSCSGSVGEQQWRQRRLLFGAPTTAAAAGSEAAKVAVALRAFAAIR
ncbi:hypothetical protein Taro_021133, partial [Colocasia esculenta]|nr:hypothetical protein [Colocasia esculenta]